MLLFLNSRLILQTLKLINIGASGFRPRRRRPTFYLPKLLFNQFVVFIVYLLSAASIQRTTYEDVKPVKHHHIVRAYSKYDIEQGDVSGETTAFFYTPTTSSASSQQQLFYPARARLLDIKRSRLNVGALSLGLIFFVGATVGTYLLLEQGRPLPTTLPFELVERDFWGAQNVPFEQVTLNPANVFNVLVSQTGGSDCATQHACVEMMKTLQKRCHDTLKQEIPYNFLIGGDGQTYEGRGWHYESGFDNLPAKNKSLIIAFIGNFNHQLPTSRQLAQAEALINESINRKRLSSAYKVYGIRNNTNSDADGAALFDHIAKHWHRWDDTIDVGQWVDNL